MPDAHVTILRLGDTETPWADTQDLEPDRFTHLPDTPWRVAILEAGMVSGAPSIALRLDTDDGRTIITETSLAVLTGIVLAARGAFPNAFAGGPLEVTEP